MVLVFASSWPLPAPAAYSHAALSEHQFTIVVTQIWSLPDPELKKLLTGQSHAKAGHIHQSIDGNSVIVSLITNVAVWAPVTGSGTHTAKSTLAASFCYLIRIFMQLIFLHLPAHLALLFLDCICCRLVGPSWRLILRSG